jgi:maleylacetoacetate isomerase
MIALYGYYRSSAAFRVRIALGLKDLEFEHRGVNLKPPVSEQHGAEYRAINPQGRLPFLVDGEVALSQSPAILEYLEDAYPEVPLLPGDTLGRARVRQLAALVGCDIHPLDNLSVLQFLKQKMGQEQATVDQWYAHWICEGFAAFEALLEEYSGKYSVGNMVTLADLYLVPQVWNARRFQVPLENYPNIVRVDAHCQEIAAFQAAAPQNQPDAPES